MCCSAGTDVLRAQPDLAGSEQPEPGHGQHCGGHYPLGRGHQTQRARRGRQEHRPADGQIPQKQKVSKPASSRRITDSDTIFSNINRQQKQAYFQGKSPKISLFSQLKINKIKNH